MAISFPTSLDNFTNPSSGNTLDSPSHSLQHSDINDAVEALEAKLGIGASPAGSATSGYVLMAGTAGTTTWSALPTQSSGLNQVVPSSVTVTGSGSSGSVNTNGLVTFTSCTDVIAKGIFSSTYNNYRVMININTTTADAQLRLKFHDGTNPSSTGYTYVSYSKTAGGSDTSFGGTNDTSLFVFGMETYSNNWYGNFVTEIYNPYKTESTFWNSYHSNIPENGTWNVAFGGGNHSPETSWTALEIYPTSGAISGTIAVYGFRI